jgi:hypothetical protein
LGKSDKIFQRRATLAVLRHSYVVGIEDILSDSRNGGYLLTDVTIMKILMQKTLGSRVHRRWFILACLLLVCVLTGAILLANQVVWRIDRTTEEITKPPSNRPHPRPLAAPNPATSH